MTCQALLSPGSTALLPHPGISFPHLPGPTRAGGCPRLCPVVPGCPGFLPGRTGPERRPRCRSRCGPHAVSMATAARAFPSAPPPSWLPLTAIPAAIPAPQRPASGSFSVLKTGKCLSTPPYPCGSSRELRIAPPGNSCSSSAAPTSGDFYSAHAVSLRWDGAQQIHKQRIVTSSARFYSCLSSPCSVQQVRFVPRGVCNS